MKSNAYGSSGGGGGATTNVTQESSNNGEEETFYTGDDDEELYYAYGDDNDGENSENITDATYYETISDTTSHKTFKEYQTDFTDAINDKYLPAGMEMTESQLVFVIGGVLVVIVAVGLSVSTFYNRRVNGGKEGDQYIRSDLMKGEGGVSA